MLTSQQTHQLELTTNYVKEALATAEAGHDWQHIQRVITNAKAILAHEDADAFVVQLACLLHDIADAKFFDGDENIGAEKTSAFLSQLSVDEEVKDEVVFIVKYMSFKSDVLSVNEKSVAFQIVQDADRLDAIGAIGIARAFHYGGFKNRALFDPSILPKIHQSKTEYKKSTAPTINHFYEKLLLLKDQMHTETAKDMAAQRHAFMLQYLYQFYMEYDLPNWPNSF